MMTESKQRPEACAVILAGGKSSRMGRRKELLTWEGRPLIAHQVEVIRTAQLPCLIVCNEQEELPRALFAAPDVQIVSDAGKSCGPLTGIVTAMQTRAEEALLILSCDLPFLRSEHLVRMLSHLPDLQKWDAAVARTQKRFHPLFALYHRRTQERFAEALQARSYRVMSVLERLRVLPLEEDWLQDGATFNMNTPEDYETALRERGKWDALS